ncbi:MAG: glycosyltransferase [Actinomyces sp.]|uniref:glycosyltransferase family 2 protein n=1 Tax=Actinomyces sp. TaxID=29317 RepID=UPI0026DDB598|nr:glycosyltransferase [Actinomyces sp.]MDO4242250.1 glycosyltransferase [Actinomyces sp.]
MSRTTEADGAADRAQGRSRSGEPVQARGAGAPVAVDIFIPFWGEPDYLYAAVRSVLAQSSPSWRLTVVDDCYPEDVSGYFADLDDKRVRYLRNEDNLGIIGNFSRCQELAEGTYTVFMGCDDLLGPRYVETIERTAARLPGVEIIQPGVEVIDESGTTVLPLSDRVKDLLRPGGQATHVLAGEDLARSLFVGDWLYWPSLALRTEALRGARFLPDYEIILDVGLLMDLITAGARLAVVPDLVFRYRRHQASLSSEALLDGPRFADERRFFAQQAARMDALGWRRAARAARRHVTSRAYALTLLPGALRARRDVRPLLRHALR